MDGTIKTLVFNKGYGFISRPGGPDAFFHMSGLDGIAFDHRLIGQRVTFDLVNGREGRPRAERVRPAA